MKVTAGLWDVVRRVRLSTSVSCINWGLSLQIRTSNQWPSFTAGVRIGVDVDLARTPAVWPPKTKWPLNEFGEDPVSELNANYPSVRLHREALLLEVQDQVEQGWAVQTTLGEASKKFGAVSISSLSII
jgi:hypothetical protein